MFWRVYKQMIILFAHHETVRVELSLSQSLDIIQCICGIVFSL